MPWLFRKAGGPLGRRTWRRRVGIGGSHGRWEVEGHDAELSAAGVPGSPSAVAAEVAMPVKNAGIEVGKLALYDSCWQRTPDVQRKGDTNPYTSSNGHMFTHLAPPGTLAMRLPPDEVEPFLKKYKTKLFESYGVVKKDWVVVPDALLEKTSELRKYFDSSYGLVKTLKPKPTSKKRPQAS